VSVPVSHFLAVSVKDSKARGGLAARGSRVGPHVKCHVGLRREERGKRGEKGFVSFVPCRTRGGQLTSLLRIHSFWLVRANLRPSIITALCKGPPRCRNLLFACEGPRARQATPLMTTLPPTLS